MQTMTRAPSARSASFAATTPPAASLHEARTHLVHAAKPRATKSRFASPIAPRATGEPCRMICLVLREKVPWLVAQRPPEAARLALEFEPLSQSSTTTSFTSQVLSPSGSNRE
jgi:hypothetical protein